MATLCRDCLRPWNDTAETCPACGSRRLISHPELTELSLAHVDCDAFYAAIEKRDNPALRDKPLLIGGRHERSVVATACYVARRFGPRSAMPMRRALELCPDAVVLPPDMEKYKRVGRQIRDIFLEMTPLVEPLSLDEAYLDLGNGKKSAARRLAAMALKIEQEIGITVSVGLAANKFLAKLASDLDKPRGFSVIGRAEAKAFLAPLPVRKVHGIGEATARRMANQGVETIGQLQAMPEAALIARFGKFGRSLALYVNGKDDRRVTPHRKRKSVSAETTFETDLTSLDALDQELTLLCHRVADRLRRDELAGGTVVLKLRTNRFQTLTRNHRLPHPTQRARVIQAQAHMLLTKEVDGRAFRLIGVGVADLCPSAEADPPDLFGGLDGSL